jgi:hypothetical protein
LSCSAALQIAIHWLITTGQQLPRSVRSRVRPSRRGLGLEASGPALSGRPIEELVKVKNRSHPATQAYYAEDDAVKRDVIAGRQLDALRQYQRPRQEKFKLDDVKRLFELMRGKG